MTEDAGAQGATAPAQRHPIDRLSAAGGAVAALALLAMALVVGFEVASRYLFNAPTIWAWDVNVQLMMLMVLLGMADVYRRDLNVRVDLLTAGLPPRRRAILDLVATPALLLVFGVMLWTGWSYAAQSWSRGQTAPTIFAPPLWPITFMIPLGAALVLAQALLKMARDIRTAFGGEGGAG